MIVGIGVDIVDRRRIGDLYKKRGNRFIARCFDHEEQQIIQRRKDKDDAMSKCWAVKEAFAKAVGFGMRQGLGFCDIGLRYDIMRKPRISTSDKAKAILKKHYGDHVDHWHIHCSISDEKTHTIAMVIIENNKVDK